jgi:hypothetical protein
MLFYVRLSPLLLRIFCYALHSQRDFAFAVSRGVTWILLTWHIALAAASIFLWRLHHVFFCSFSAGCSLHFLSVFAVTVSVADGVCLSLLFIIFFLHSDW